MMMLVVVRRHRGTATGAATQNSKRPRLKWSGRDAQARANAAKMGEVLAGSVHRCFLFPS